MTFPLKARLLLAASLTVLTLPATDSAFAALAPTAVAPAPAPAAVCSTEKNLVRSTKSAYASANGEYAAATKLDKSAADAEATALAALTAARSSFAKAATAFADARAAVTATPSDATRSARETARVAVEAAQVGVASAAATFATATTDRQGTYPDRVRSQIARDDALAAYDAASDAYAECLVRNSAKARVLTQAQSGPSLDTVTVEFYDLAPSTSYRFTREAAVCGRAGADCTTVTAATDGAGAVQATVAVGCTEATERWTIADSKGTTIASPVLTLQPSNCPNPPESYSTLTATIDGVYSGSEYKYYGIVFGGLQPDTEYLFSSSEECGTPEVGCGQLRRTEQDGSWRTNGAQDCHRDSVDWAVYTVEGRELARFTLDLPGICEYRDMP